MRGGDFIERALLDGKHPDISDRFVVKQSLVRLAYDPGDRKDVIFAVQRDSSLFARRGDGIGARKPITHDKDASRNLSLEEDVGTFLHCAESGVGPKG